MSQLRYRASRPLSPPFDRQPTLTGELVELRPLRAEDYDALYAVAADPLMWAQHPAKDRHREPVFRQLFQESLASGGALVIIGRAAGRIIGSSRYHGWDPDRGEIEIGWTFLARAHWGGAHNAEVKRLMLEHAFRFVDRVIFLVGPENLRSQRALEKIGAVRAGTRVDVGGRESVVYEMLAPSLRR
jgi:RimJ/RimL family protein N-acetyltransferase